MSQGEKIAAAQSTVRHLLSELRDLDNVLTSCTSTSERRSTPKSFVDELQRRGNELVITPRGTGNAKAKSRRLRISPVLLSMKEGYSPLVVRQNPAAKGSKARTPPPLQVWRELDLEVAGETKIKTKAKVKEKEKEKEKEKKEKIGENSTHRKDVSPAAVSVSSVERNRKKSDVYDSIGVPHTDYLALRQQNAKLQEEIGKLKEEKDLLKKSNEGEKKDLLKRFKELRRNREELLEDNQRLQMNQINLEKKYRRASGRLSIVESSFNKMKAKYNEVNQREIDLTFQLAYMKQDAFRYQQIDDGEVRKVLEECSLALKHFEDRERSLVKEVEEVQNSLEDLEVQVVLLNEINRGLRGMVVSDAKKEITQIKEENAILQTTMDKRISQVHAIAHLMEEEKDNIRNEFTLLSEELLHKDGEVQRLEAILKKVKTNTRTNQVADR